LSDGTASRRSAGRLGRAGVVVALGVALVLALLVPADAQRLPPSSLAAPAPPPKIAPPAPPPRQPRPDDSPRRDSGDGHRPDGHPGWRPAPTRPPHAYGDPYYRRYGPSYYPRYGPYYPRYGPYYYDPPRYGPYYVPPPDPWRPGPVWVPGHWVWDGWAWVWQPGYWRE
jgi:hypothetical protein